MFLLLEKCLSYRTRSSGSDGNTFHRFENYLKIENDIDSVLCNRDVICCTDVSLQLMVNSSSVIFNIALIGVLTYWSSTSSVISLHVALITIFYECWVQLVLVYVFESDKITCSFSLTSVQFYYYFRSHPQRTHPGTFVNPTRSLYQFIMLGL